MNDHEFAHRVRNFQRLTQRLEGLLLEQLDSLERLALDRLHLLELLEKARADLDRKEAQAKRILVTDPSQRAACEKTLRIVQQRRTYYKNADRQSKVGLKQAYRRTRAGMAKYQDHLAQVEDAKATREQMIQQEQLQEASGPGLLETLGMALFAWRTSNAFDDKGNR